MKIKSKNTKFSFTVAVLCVIIIILSVSGCSADSTSKNISSSDSGVNSNSSETKVEEMIKIETPYCTLQYPKKWEQYLECSEKNKDGVFSETFYCCLNDQKKELFTVHFGSKNEGDLIGYITKDDEKIPFTVTSPDYDFGKKWTDEDIQIFNGMADGVNEVIQSVMSNENFLES